MNLNGLMDDAEAWAAQYKVEDSCLRELYLFLIMDRSKGIIPLRPWSVMK